MKIFCYNIRQKSNRGRRIMTNENKRAQMVSYCRNITKKKLMSLWLAALLLFLGASACVYGWMQLGADKSGWDYMEYIKLVIGWGGAVFFFASGAGTAYTAVRDAFWPQKSTLARSIRSQLPPIRTLRRMSVNYLPWWTRILRRTASGWTRWQAAEGGQLECWFGLGRCYELGRGTEKDVSYAAQCYQKGLTQKKDSGKWLRR